MLQKRIATIAVVVGLGAVVVACTPVAPPPPPPPPPSASTCAAPPDQDHDGKTEYFAVVDDGVGGDQTVPFEAASELERQREIAEIEATEGDVVGVEFNLPVSALAIDDPVYVGGGPDGPQWGIDTAGFEQAWANAISDGSGVSAAVLDTGVEAAHEDLTGGVVSGEDFVPGAPAANDGTDDFHSAGSTSHGTHVAGILGARDNVLGGIGGAPGVTILPVRVLDANGSGDYATVIAGIDFAVANGADVISMSLGGTGFSQAMQNSVTAAVNAGIVVVAAAGNSGTCNALYPAALGGVLGVAATVQSPADTLASYSERGPNVDIAAPGSGIWSTVKQAFAGVKYGQKSGTSMATPFVSAAAALLIAKCGVTWGASTPAQVESRLQTTAVPIAGNPIEAGSGSMRADAATALAC